MRVTAVQVLHPAAVNARSAPDAMTQPETLPWRPLRRRVHALLEPSDASGPSGLTPVAAGRRHAAFALEGALVAVILINTASLILWTAPQLSRAYAGWFHAVEYFTVAVFLLEYALRFWAAPEANPEARPWRQRWRYARSPAALVDAAALIPSAAAVVALLAYGDGLNLSFLLTVRLLTRTVKLARYFHGWRRLGLAFRLKTGQLVTAVAGLLAVHTIAASLMYFAESKAQPDVFSSIPAAMWWSVVTLTTVGYGDAVPVTDAGRALAAVIAVLGIGLFALPAGILSAGLWEADLAAAPPAPRPDGSDSGSGATPAAGNYCPHCGQRLPESGAG